jgi:hypothetical protein
MNPALNLNKTPIILVDYEDLTRVHRYLCAYPVITVLNIASEVE